MSQLPVREHRAQEPELRRPLYTPKPKIRTKPSKVVNGRKRGGSNRKGIIVGARHFDSVRACLDMLKIHHSKLYAMLATGEAKYKDAQ